MRLTEIRLWRGTSLAAKACSYVERRPSIWIELETDLVEPLSRVDSLVKVPYLCSDRSKDTIRELVPFIFDNFKAPLEVRNESVEILLSLDVGFICLEGLL